MCSYKQLCHSSQFRPPQTYRSARLSPPPKRSPQQKEKKTHAALSVLLSSRCYISENSIIFDTAIHATRGFRLGEKLFQ